MVCDQGCLIFPFFLFLCLCLGDIKDSTANTATTMSDQPPAKRVRKPAWIMAQLMEEVAEADQHTPKLTNDGRVKGKADEGNSEWCIPCCVIACLSMEAG